MNLRTLRRPQLRALAFSGNTCTLRELRCLERHLPPLSEACATRTFLLKVVVRGPLGGRSARVLPDGCARASAHLPRMPLAMPISFNEPAQPMPLSPSAVQSSCVFTPFALQPPLIDLRCQCMPTIQRPHAAAAADPPRLPSRNQQQPPVPCPPSSPPAAPQFSPLTSRPSLLSCRRPALPRRRHLPHHLHPLHRLSLLLPPPTKSVPFLPIALRSAPKRSRARTGARPLAHRHAAPATSRRWLLLQDSRLPPLAHALRTTAPPQSPRPQASANGGGRAAGARCRCAWRCCSVARSHISPRRGCGCIPPPPPPFFCACCFCVAAAMHGGHVFCFLQPSQMYTNATTSCKPGHGQSRMSLLQIQHLLC